MKLELKFLSKLRLGTKFLFLGLVILPVIGVPTYFFAKDTQSDIDFALTEEAGDIANRSLVKFVQLAHQHRILANSVAIGDSAAAPQREAVEKAVTQSVAGMITAAAATGNARIIEAVGKTEKAWAAIRGSVAKAEAAKLHTDHSNMIWDLINTMELFLDHYKLTLDPDAHTYFLIQAALVHLPQYTEALGRSRTVGVNRLHAAAAPVVKGVAAPEANSAIDRLRMTSLIDSAQVRWERAENNFQKAMEASPEFKTQLEKSVAEASARHKALVSFARKELIDNSSPSLPPADWSRQFTNALEAVFVLTEQSEKILDHALEEKATGLGTYRATVLAGLGLLLLVVIALAYLITRNVRTTVAELQDSVEKVRAGDVAALGSIDAKDEIGDLGRTVNSLLEERVAAQKKAEAENDALNNSVIGLLQAMHQLSQRDLTAKAPVTADVVGTVSDSVNQLTTETGKVLYRVTQVAGEVEDASAKVKGQADLVQITAEQERKGVDEMTRELGTATEAMNRVSQLADNSNKIAGEATASTKSALDTVNSTVKGMDAIRETIAETEKRIKRLGERSQEISGIVNLINTIAERTHVLALNASVQAAVAGEAGRGFAVVAEEVQRLAESSRNATAQIGTLVNNIQIETNDTINTVNRTISQVVQGTEFAQKAGEQMAATQQITQNLVDQVQKIASGAAVQMKIAENLKVRIAEIGKSTQQTAQQIAAQSVETNQLASSAVELVQAVSVFKLPDAKELGVEERVRTGSMPVLKAA